jgi:mannose-6-phosphate isomerase-like protein (cupin superfamily)
MHKQPKLYEMDLGKTGKWKVGENGVVAFLLIGSGLIQIEFENESFEIYPLSAIVVARGKFE